MTPAALRSTLAALGWSSRHLARLLSLAERSPWNWLAGRSPVPHDVAAWLARRLADHHRTMQNDPPP